MSTCLKLPFLFLLLAPFLLSAQSSNFKHRLIQTEEISYQRPDSAFRLIKDIYDKTNKAGDHVASGVCLQQMGAICFRLGHYAQAFDFYSQADRVFRQQNELLLLAKNLNGLGVLYYYNKQVDLAKRHYHEALKIFSKLKDAEGLAASYSKIGHLYEKQNKSDSAFYFEHKALEYISKTGKLDEIAKIYENIGSIHEDLAKYDSAGIYFNKSLALYRQSNNQTACVEVLNNLGDILRKTGNPQAALDQSRKALELASATNDLYGKASAYRDIAKAFNQLQQNDSAYHYLELSRDITMDLYSEDGIRQTAFLQVLYNFDQQRKEIQRLEGVSRANSIITICTIIIILLLGVLGWAIISRQRFKIRDQKAISRQQEHLYENQKKLMEIELENKKLQEENLTQLLELKSTELSNHLLNLVQKNQTLEELKTRLMLLLKDDKRDHKKQLQQIVHQINHSFTQEQHWKSFTGIFEQVHQSFFDSLKQHCDQLTPNDIRLLSLIKLNLPPKDTATLLGISPESLRVSRYRLKKKLNIPENESLSSFIHGISSPKEAKSPLTKS